MYTILALAEWTVQIVRYICLMDVFGTCSDEKGSSEASCNAPKLLWLNDITDTVKHPVHCELKIRGIILYNKYHNPFQVAED